MIKEFKDSDEAYNFYIKNKPWGMETIINIYDVDIDLITDRNIIEEYVVKLCDVIDMKRFGEPFIERFGAEESNLYGFSMSQMISTSCITAHFSEKDRKIFIDCFSCKAYSPKDAIDFSKKFFNGKEVEYTILMRD
jgi:S-adenosylmethionine/arginine decarboxylase-like enzyme